MSDPAQITELSLRLSGHVLFDGLSLNLRENRIGIIGRNGSGKSLLARVLCGLILPDKGRVLVHGIDVAKDRKQAINTVGILFQNPDQQIIFPMVDEEIAFGLTQQGHSKSKARAAALAMLARFQASEWAGRSVQTLSQGQRHLVCLMSVLAMAPKLILLDEPFAGLDALTVARLNRILDAVSQQVIHISHDLAALETYDRVIWLEQGRVAMDGTPAAVIAAYRAEMDRRGQADAVADL